MTDRQAAERVTWVRKPYEDRMDLFFAASDFVVARAGGAVAEIVATASPSVLIPGEFGSSGHQRENALFLEEAGAALVLGQEDIDQLPLRLGELLEDPNRLVAMRHACHLIARPDAAKTIAQAMIEAAS
jgi:UDP-N-acetylglucosamine--N-acetylmuramyl-(pentapeptide) pyrophosphoryl-undecaprenol N-acetylglucosamine transferase